MYDGIVSFVDVSDGCTFGNAASRREECHDGRGQGNGFLLVPSRGLCWSIKDYQ